MKVTKTVKDGNINVELVDVPQYPEGTRVHGKTFHLTLDKSGLSFHNWCQVHFIEIGNFESLVNLDDMLATDPVESIANRLLRAHESTMREYNEFIAKHTESLEVMTKAQVLETLVSADKLCYRDKSGKFQTLDI